MKDLIFKSLQVFGFCLLFALFKQYYDDRRGIEYSTTIRSGAKMYRDADGVKNILADTLEDAYFALGFAHAEDRLWQMYMGYKVAVGELSEIFGQDALIVDEFSRTLNFKQVCINSISSLDENEKKNVQYYVDGVNHYIQSSFLLPLEFMILRVPAFEWNLESSCLVNKIIEYCLTSDFIRELLRSYLKDNLYMSQDIIEKILPFDYTGHEYKKTILRDDEMPHLRYEKVIKTKEDVKYAKVADNQVIGINIHDGNQRHQHSEITNGEATLEVDVDLASKVPKGEPLRPFASNNCVIGGKHTENGHPFVYNDPHLFTGMPAFWYFVHIKISAKDDYDFIGATHPGTPVLFIGSNSYVAWGITNGFADTSDILKLDKSYVNSEKMEFTVDKKSHKIHRRIDRIYTDTKRTAYIEKEFLTTEFGPIINTHESSLFELADFPSIPNLLNDKKYYYILRGTFSDFNDKNLKSALGLALSKDYKAFRENLANMSISLCFVYADKDDNFGFQYTGKIPKRSRRGEGSYIHEITSDQDLYTTPIPFHELPYVINPERGFVVTSNNLVIGDDYKYILPGAYLMDSRAVALEGAIEVQIKSGQKINAEFIFEKLFGNVFDATCPEVLTFVRLILIKEGYSLSSSLFISELENFDCQMKGDSLKALLYNTFLNELHHLLHYYDKKKLDDPEIQRKIDEIAINLEDRGNYLAYKLNHYFSHPSTCMEEYGFNCAQLIFTSFDNAIISIKHHLGNNINDWKWENLNIKHYQHRPFSMIPGINLLAHRMVKTDGNQYTPKVSVPKFYHRKYEGECSSNLKFLTNLHDYQNQTYFSIDCGQNGRIFHRHYDDRCISHEQGSLVHFDSRMKEEFTFELKKKEK